MHISAHRCIHTQTHMHTWARTHTHTHSLVVTTMLKCCCFFFSDKFHQMKACADTYYIVVIEDTGTGQVIGSASLIKEHKFIHSATAVRWPF